MGTRLANNLLIKIEVLESLLGTGDSQVEGFGTSLNKYISANGTRSGHRFTFSFTS